jgi:hypothetical protein
LVTVPIKAGKEYIMEPNEELLIEQGILVARGITKIWHHNLIEQLANVSANEVTLAAFQKIACMEE